MQKKTYAGVEISIYFFDTEEVILASTADPSTKPDFDGTQGSNDLPIL